MIELRFRQRGRGLTYEFSVRCARNVDDPQNEANLTLARRLRQVDHPLWQRATSTDPSTKFEQTILAAPEKDYVSLDDLLTDAGKDLEAFLPIVDRLIGEVRSEYPDFTAHRITAEEFGRMQQLLENRQHGPTRSDRYPSDRVAEEPAPYTAATNKYSKPATTPLNQLFYGPPGTGKTYETITEAVRITNPAFPVADRTREEVRAEYHRLTAEGRIVFTTFHQSLSYEDFVEGIKPTLSQGESTEGELAYALVPGIFRELVQTVITANEAARNQKTRAGLLIDKQIIRKAQPYKMSLGAAREESDRTIYDYCLANDCISLGYGGEVDFTGVANEKEILARIQQRGSEVSLSRYELAAIRTFVVSMKPGDLVFVPDGLQTIGAVGVVTGDYYCDPQAPIRYSQFRKVRWLYGHIAYPVKTVYGKSFNIRTVYALDKSAMEEGLLREHDHRPASNNYVLVIDEINRGNVSRIFGELITLLESDKRQGRPEALTVTLPYSRESFGIPANLYLIGTMNTADRSVEALDSALRRRFTFREITARPELLADLQIADISVAQLLRTLNGRIERLLDKDHRVGHAYFLGLDGSVAGLRAVFSRQVVPLLEEYFFGDTHKLRLVLGVGFFERLDTVIPFADGTATGYADDAPRYRLLDLTQLTDEQFLDALHALL